MEVTTYINVIAVIVAPIIAVWIGQRLQDRAQKRHDKMQIFKTLMASRAYMTKDAVIALNIIEIVFADDKNVIKQWKRYYDRLCTNSPTEIEIKRIGDERNKLLETMSTSLGYKGVIDWETIQNPYLPKGMVDEINNEQNMKNLQQEVLDVVLASQK